LQLVLYVYKSSNELKHFAAAKKSKMLQEQPEVE